MHTSAVLPYCEGRCIEWKGSPSPAGLGGVMQNVAFLQLINTNRLDIGLCLLTGTKKLDRDIA